jgi:hypothetical protein
VSRPQGQINRRGHNAVRDVVQTHMVQAHNSPHKVVQADFAAIAKSITYAHIAIGFLHHLFACNTHVIFVAHTSREQNILFAVCCRVHDVTVDKRSTLLFARVVMVLDWHTADGDRRPLQTALKHSVWDVCQRLGPVGEAKLTSGNGTQQLL